MNIHEDKYLQVAKNLARELKIRFPYILGVSICGSVVCGNADEYSDIDLDIWLNDDAKKQWGVKCPLMDCFEKYAIMRETPSNFSFGIGDDYKFDLTILSIDEVEKEEWKVEQKANRNNSMILIDSNDIVKNTLSKKLGVETNAFVNKEKYDVNVPNSKDYYEFYISAYLNYHVPVAIARKSFEQAHLNLTWATNLLIELLWTKYHKYYPYMKSRLFVADNLNEDEKKMLSECQIVKAHNEDDIKRRREIIRELYKLLGYKEITFYHEKLDLS